MPHFGHAPGWSWLTSGSMGQMYSGAIFCFDLGSVVETAFEESIPAGGTTKSFLWAEGAGASRYFSGAAANFAAQPWEQK